METVTESAPHFEVEESYELTPDLIASHITHLFSSIETFKGGGLVVEENLVNHSGLRSSTHNWTSRTLKVQGHLVVSINDYPNGKSDLKPEPHKSTNIYGAHGHTLHITEFANGEVDMECSLGFDNSKHEKKMTVNSLQRESLQKEFGIKLNK